MGRRPERSPVLPPPLDRTTLALFPLHVVGQEVFDQEACPGEVVNVIFLSWCMFSAVTERKDGEKERERVSNRRETGETKERKQKACERMF